MREWEEAENERKEAALKNNETFVPEKKEWPSIDPEPFESEDVKFIVCLDTLGQDRELSDDQKRRVLNHVNKFREIWEQREIKTLEQDRNQKIKTSDEDKIWIAENAERIKDEEEKFAEVCVKELDEDNQPEDDDHKSLILN